MKIRMFGFLAGVVFAFLLGAARARAEWRRAETPNFVLYGNIPEARLRERILLLEDFDRLMRVATSGAGPPAGNTLNVYILDGAADLRLIRPLPNEISGLYTATPYGIAAFVDGRAEAGGNEILFHEYAHHFMMQYAPAAYPAWYIEGFAEYFMTARFTPRHINIGNFSPSRAYALTERDWLPMDQILFGTPQGFAGSEAMQQFYAQSWLTVHYFYSTPERQAALRRYLVAARGDNPRGALQAVTGMDPAAFTQELRRYIRGGQIRYRQMTRSAGEAPPQVSVTVLPAAADDMMVYRAALAIGIEEGKGADYLQRIRAAAARHGGDTFAQRGL